MGSSGSIAANLSTELYNLLTFSFSVRLAQIHPFYVKYYKRAVILDDCHLYSIGQKEDMMFALIKWIFVGLFAGLAWLVAGYALEYFRPYKRVEVRLRNME